MRYVLVFGFLVLALYLSNCINTMLDLIRSYLSYKLYAEIMQKGLVNKFCLLLHCCASIKPFLLMIVRSSLTVTIWAAFPKLLFIHFHLKFTIQVNALTNPYSLETWMKTKRISQKAVKKHKITCKFLKFIAEDNQ